MYGTCSPSRLQTDNKHNCVCGAAAVRACVIIIEVLAIFFLQLLLNVYIKCLIMWILTLINIFFFVFSLSLSLFSMKF